MGTTTAIQRLQAATPSLVGVIQSQMQAMDTAMSSVITAFDPFVASFYAAGKWDQQLLGQEVRRDVQQESTFTLDMISGVITQLANNILKGNIASLVGGDPAVDAAKVGSALATSVTGVPAAADFMVQAAVAAISSVMGLFNTRATSHVGYGMESHRVGPGLTLHAYSYSSAVGASAATGNDAIMMTAIGYKLVYSFAQAGAEDDMALMAYYSAQMKSLEAALQKRQTEINTLIADPNTTLDELTKAQNFFKLASTELDDFKLKVQAIIKQYSGQ